MTDSTWKTARERQHSLYPGQREALTRRMQGQTNESIAEAMQISKPTVASYLGAAKVALNADSFEHAGFIALGLGLVPYYREA